MWNLESSPGEFVYNTQPLQGKSPNAVPVSAKSSLPDADFIPVSGNTDQKTLTAERCNLDAGPRKRSLPMGGTNTGQLL